ncbi:MAG: cytochrome c family protein [Cystobacterineae bacterium]|nr:cytochrome c family protein [Cystobacterineae bacterium]MCL2258801.1 cytochrome c family protein [Cystobacterineae bacterium]
MLFAQLIAKAKGMRFVRLALLFGLPFCLVPWVLADDFVGPETCQGCHPQAYAQWKASAHARAMEGLKAEQRRDSRCLSCHAPAWTSQAQPGVGCESCHGGGQHYSKGFIMKDEELSRLLGLVDPSEKTCRSCHDGFEPSVEGFDFQKKLKAIEHWTHGRQPPP